jgi:hypothetical protein
MATFNWVISTTEYDLQPADMDGAIIVAHWRCNAEQTEGTGDDLDKKLGSLGFNMDQLKVGREAFVNMLAASLAKAENVENAIEVDG